MSKWILHASFFLILATTHGDLICEFNNTDLICTPNDTEYTLQRGVVSDNNKTTSISLRACGITEIKLESFQNLFYLKSLDLSENKISVLKLGVFDGTKLLTKLNISYNSITELLLGLFDQKPNLLTLDLKANKLVNLKLGIFDALKKLKYLDLSYNSLRGKDLNSYIFDRNNRITYLDFSGNNMNDVPNNLLHSLQVLEKLYLNQCLLSYVPIFATQTNLNTIKQLELSKNSITKLDNSTDFSNLENLERIDLAENKIEHVHENIFKTLKKLKVIVLRKNKLTYIPDILFQNMQSLSTIDLSFNSITEVPVNAFRGTGLKYLNLSNNKFTYLVDNFCLELRNSGVQLVKFFFNQNPWQCSCLLDILNEVKNFKIDYNGAQYDGERPVCVSTREFHCKRQQMYNDLYVTMYDNLVK